jgi:hypothetical protein
MYVLNCDGEQTFHLTEQDAYEHLAEQVGAETVETEITPELLTAQLNGEVFSHLDEQARKDVLYDAVDSLIDTRKLARERVIGELQDILRETEPPADVHPNYSDNHTRRLCDMFHETVSDEFADAVSRHARARLSDKLCDTTAEIWDNCMNGNPALADDDELETAVEELIAQRSV